MKKSKLIQLFSLTYFLHLLSMHKEENNLLFFVADMPKETRILKRKLNRDFYVNAKINGLVSYIYYPSSEAKQGHSELEIEGSCWSTTFAHEKYESLEKKIKRSIIEHPTKPWRMAGRFFIQYLITVSPNQLENLKNELRNRIKPINPNLLEVLGGLTYKTCSYNVLTKLSETCDFDVPMPYKISPFLSELYIKTTNPVKIKEIRKYGKKCGFDGEIGEIVIIACAIICPLIFVFYVLTFLGCT